MTCHSDIRFIVLTLATAALAGCAVGPDYERPEVQIAPAY